MRLGVPHINDYGRANDSDVTATTSITVDQYHGGTRFHEESPFGTAWPSTVCEQGTFGYRHPARSRR
ncbi:MAG: hypothetical protein QOJ52_3172, partial [Acidimicrobiaceae bacterium]|nr:hypothetical protein [Acidimicrobiaceae bacterium]